MSTEVRLRGGTSAQHSTFAGASREVTVDTTKRTLVVHDGATEGGNPLATQATVDSALALKADASALALKADASALALKADASALALRLRFDAAQSLSLLEREQAIANLGGGLVFLSAGSGTGLASLDMSLPAQFDRFKLVLTSSPSAGSAGNIPFLRISDDGGATYETTGYYYSALQAANSTQATISGNNASAISFGATQNVAPGLFEVDILNSGSLPEFLFDAHYPSSPGATRISGGGYYGTSGKATHLRFLMSAGTFFCSYKLFGIM